MQKKSNKMHETEEDVVGSLFSVITANGLCYSGVFSNTVMSRSVICIRFSFVFKFE